MWGVSSPEVIYESWRCKDCDWGLRVGAKIAARLDAKDFEAIREIETPAGQAVLTHLKQSGHSGVAIIERAPQLEAAGLKKYGEV